MGVVLDEELHLGLCLVVWGIMGIWFVGKGLVSSA